LDYVFYVFLNATSKKRKKSRFFGFSKKSKKRILELWLQDRVMTRIRGNVATRFCKGN